MVREKVSTSIDMPLSDECKRILAYSNEEAERLNHRSIGTEHLLLGILREEKCVAAEILTSRGLRVEAIREEVARSKDFSQASGFLSPSVRDGLLTLNSETLFRALDTHGLTASRKHLSTALHASNYQDWNKAQTELQLFLQTLVDGTSDKLGGDDVAFPILEGFDWHHTMQNLRTGLSADDDWRFRWWLTVLLAELLLKRFEQRLNS